MEKNIISKKDIIKIVNNLSSSACEFIEYDILPFSDEPLGFLSEHSRLHICVKTTEEEKETVFCFFMKTVPNASDFHKKYVADIEVFEKEARLYKDVLNNLQAYTTKQFSPVCYLTNINSFIVLEDLSLKGYKTVKDKSIMLDLQHCKCVVETLARFHAASIILEERNSTKSKPYRLSDYYQNALFETTFSYTPGHPRNNWLSTTMDTLICLCKQISAVKHDDIESRLQYFKQAMRDYIAPSKKYRNVISHADLWSNNIMFKYGEDSMPEHCILVDFQMARYVPPAFDFLSFLYLTTPTAFLQQHFMLLVDIYYSTFVPLLEQYDLNADFIMSKVKFLECCDYYRVPALLEAAMFGTIVYLNANFSKEMLSNEEKFHDFMYKDRTKLVCDVFKNDNVYRRRLTNLVTQLLNAIL